MKFAIAVIQIVSFVFILGCSSKDESLNRLLYETGQRYDQQKCRKNPTAKCNIRKSYEQYQKERDNLLKKKAERIE